MAGTKLARLPGLLVRLISASGVIIGSIGDRLKTITQIQGGTDNTVIGNEGDRLKAKAQVAGGTDNTVIGNEGDRLKAKAQVAGGTDNTVIGNIGDHLKMITSPILSRDVLYFNEFLKNLGSKEMDVNGSISSVDFSYGPSGSDIVYLDSFSIFMFDGNANDQNKFANLAALTNGLLLKVTSKGITQNIINLQDNAEITAQMEITHTPTGSGFLADPRCVKFAYYFKNPVILQASTSDKITATVRDDLTLINRLIASAKFFKINP